MNDPPTNDDHGYPSLRIEADQLSFIPAENSDPDPIFIGSLARLRNMLAGNHLTSAAVEHAINETEDLIMPVVRSLPDGAALKLSGPEWENIFHLFSATDGVSVAIESVENLYRQLADYAAGIPLAWRHATAPEQIAIGLLILREVMHHAGFRSVSLAFPAEAQDDQVVIDKSSLRRL